MRGSVIAANDREAFERASNEYVPLLALSHSLRPPNSTLATPHAFVCDGGQVMWVKSKAQNGLSSELVAGRIGFELGVSPEVDVVNVPASALAEDGSSNHLEGLNFGSAHLPGCTNAKDLGKLGANFDMNLFEGESWARATIFQSFLDVSDTQVLINMSSGRVWSIDHGHALSEAYMSPPPDNVSVKQRSVSILGATVSLLDYKSQVVEVVEEIEALEDEDLLSVVCGMPDAERWKASDDTRFNVWQVLKKRRNVLRETVEQWIS